MALSGRRTRPWWPRKVAVCKRRPYKNQRFLWFWNHSKTKSVYDAYRKSGYDRNFYEQNKEALLLHKAAKTAFAEFGKGTLPKYKELTEEYTKVLEQKKEWYREYREVRSAMKKFQLAQEITRTFLNEEQQMPKRGLVERWVSGDWGFPNKWSAARS